MLISYMAIPGVPQKEISFYMSKKLQIEVITKTVCDFFGVGTECIKEMTRKRACADARHSIYYFVDKICGIAINDTASKFDRDHTTILHGIKKIKGLMFSDDMFKMEIYRLNKSIEKAIADKKKQMNENIVSLPQ